MAEVKENEQLQLFDLGEDEESKKTEKKQEVKDKKKNDKNEKIEKKENPLKTIPKKIQKFKYPFGIYTNGRTIDISNYGFEEGKEYTENEIAKIMLSHRHYEFSADNKHFKFIKEDNMVYYSGSDFKKG